MVLDLRLRRLFVETTDNFFFLHKPVDDAGRAIIYLRKNVNFANNSRLTDIYLL